jgi:hypothetical protein
MSLFELFFRYVGLYFMIFFVFKKASKPLKNKDSWMNYGLWPTIVISLLVNTGFMIYLEYHIIKLTTEKDPVKL